MRGRPSQYADQFEALIRAAGPSGVAGPEIRERTGASTQTVYGWLKRSELEGNIVETSKTTDSKAVRYRWADELASDRTIIPSGAVAVGRVYRLVGVLQAPKESGRVFLTFEDDDGNRFEASASTPTG